MLFDVLVSFDAELSVVRHPYDGARSAALSLLAEIGSDVVAVELGEQLRFSVDVGGDDRELHVLSTVFSEALEAAGVPQWIGLVLPPRSPRDRFLSIFRDHLRSFGLDLPEVISLDLWGDDQHGGVTLHFLRGVGLPMAPSDAFSIADAVVCAFADFRDALMESSDGH